MMGGQRYVSWGRYPRVHQQAIALRWRQDPLPRTELGNTTLLPFGNGRSYGDVCLNEGAALVDTRPLDHFIHFDAATGLLRCESGVLLSEVLALVIPQGWFLPVTPGTQYVTVGGAIANDVHGKNHHRAGTFGCHLKAFELLRSDGSRRVCAPLENTDWYQATIGGLGLTGVITWSELQLKPMATPYIAQETVRYDSLDAFFELSAESDESHEYTVAWVDCLASGRQLGRGLFIRGNHTDEPPEKPVRVPDQRFGVPVELPVSLINHSTLKLFNVAYYHKQRARRKAETVHFAPFFYPLDAIDHWNRLYGPKGFLQYQCVVPTGPGPDAIREILERIATAGTGSFLAVLKVFGDQRSPGLLSFPQPGITLALDFPNRGPKTFSLLDELDVVVRAAGGALYPAKDARMSGEDFRRSYPSWKTLETMRDPCFDSSFWRRMKGDRP